MDSHNAEFRAGKHTYELALNEYAGKQSDRREGREGGREGRKEGRKEGGKEGWKEGGGRDRQTD